MNYIALLGWNPGDEREIMSMEELVGAFSLRGISKSPAIFDYDKLRWFNAQYIRALPAARFRDLILPYMEKAVDTARIDTLRLAQLLQPRCETLTEVTEMIGFLAQMPPFDASLYTNKKMKTTPETSLPVLQALLPVLEAVDCWSESAVRDAVTAFIEAEGLKNGPVLWPLRVALSNSMYTPGGAYEIAGLLGREEALQRLRGSIAGLLQA